jgi:hypothetical protein
MNCQVVRNQLLVLPDPRRPAADLRVHLHGCAACRQWQRRLIELERHVPLLPVPPSTLRADVVRRFIAGSSGPARAAGDRALPRRGLSLPAVPPTLAEVLRPVRAWWQQWHAAAGVAAVFLVLILAGWALWTSGPEETTASRKRPAPDSFLATLFKRDLRLAVAETPRERLEALLDLADDLRGQTRTGLLVAAAEDLENLAQLYDQVIREGVVAGARKLPRGQRRELLDPIADRLTRTGLDADREAGRVPESSAEALRLIAAAARDAGDQLRTLAHESIQ